MKSRWNNGLLWLGIVWGVLLIAFCLMSCRTKSVVEVIEVHDTLRTHSVDTFTVYKSKEVHDTLRLTDYIKVTVKESGETIRVDRWRDRWQTIEVHDTVDSYKAKYDSLLAVKSQTHEKEVVKQASWWQRLGWQILGAVLFAGIIIAIIIRLKKTKI
jgi:hypothetical protein